MRTVFTSLLRLVPAWGRWHRTVRVLLRINVSLLCGTKGFVHWRFSSWERATPEGGYEGGPLNYGEQDIAAQGNLTEAVFDWLDDENNVHPTHLKQSLAGVQPALRALLQRDHKRNY